MTPQTATSSLDATAALIEEALKTGFCDDVEGLELATIRLARESIDTARQVSLMLDAARFFYISGRAPQGIRVALAAKDLSITTSQPNATVAAYTLLGVCCADAGDIPRAMEAYAEGLTLVTSTGDLVQEAKLWHNTGAALSYAGLFKEAIACCNKALTLCAQDDRAKATAPLAHSNIALYSLYIGDVEAGIASIEKSLSLASDPIDAHSIQNRVLAENYFARLLIENNDVDGARLHAAEARKHALNSRSPRADIQASVAEGLAETFSGDVDVGVARLKSTLERAKSLNTVSREVLAALVKALEFAGRHDEALTYLQAMLAQQRQYAEANVLQHVRTHLAQLHTRDSDTPMEDLEEAMLRVEARVEVVEDRAARSELIKRRQELFKARVEAMERMAVLAELRDDATGAHSYRVGRLASILAKEAGCDNETVFMVDIAARLHDIGKAGIPDGVLLKPGAFNTAERLVMETHSEIGASILAQSDIPNIEMAVSIARHHHERWDGRGYPAKIGGEEIPLTARITALADVFDALTHKRPYKPAWSVESALLEIASLHGTHFDPELTHTFLSLVSRLQREHPKLDDFLGEAALASPFIKARGKIMDTLLIESGVNQSQLDRSINLQR